MEFTEGSPPPTRGTPLPDKSGIIKTGITPAYAGNTNLNLQIRVILRDHPRLRGEHLKKRRSRMRWIWDHPRLRGEHFNHLMDAMRYAGSPPPTRGTLSYIALLVIVIRITPAYAGNTFKHADTRIIIRDHPRLRGEHRPVLCLPFVLPGSPPPTRGTLLFFEKHTTSSGITPAYAGNTVIRSLKYAMSDYINP